MAEKYNAVLVAESSCRFIRNWRFHPYKKLNVLPIIHEYEGLKRDTDRVTLATIQPPDRTWKRIKAYQAKRGQFCKNIRGGRPPKKHAGYKKERRDKHLKTVQRLYAKYGSVAKTMRILEKNTGERIAWSTVKDWIHYQKP